MGALMISAVFVLQVSCCLFPLLGPILSAGGTLFVAVAGVLLQRRAVIVYLGAGLLMLAVSPRYALEFLATTGFVGLALGLRMEKNPVLSLLISGFGMFAGLCVLPYLIGAAAFGGLFTALTFAACLPVFAIFSATYPALCFIILRRLMRKPIFKYHF